MSTVSEQVEKDFPEITSDQRARMFELLRQEEELDLKVFRIKSDLKEAKEEAEFAHQELKDYLKRLRGDQKPMPLFDSKMEVTISRRPDNPNEEPHEEEPAGEPGKPWRNVLLETLFNGVALKRLQDANLETVGDMADFTSHSRITDIEGIGHATADKIEKRMVEYWAENPVD